MFGDLALKLVQEARAAEMNHTLQPYKYVNRLCIPSQLVN